MTKRVALVLGSGGARGIAHVGVIRELLSRGYEITAVSGASMGALIGGVWAAGKLDEYCEWAEKLDYLDMVRLLDVSLLDPGVIKGDKLFDRIRQIVGDCRIEQLPVPYTAVAASLTARKEVWFQRGDLITAIRASCAIPSLFKPVKMHGQLLVDGAVLNPLPLAPAGAALADLVIAVNVLGEPEPDFDQQESPEEEGSLFTGLLNRWVPKQKNEKKRLEKSMGLLDVSNQSMELMQQSLTRYKMAGYVPDILVTVPKNICQFYEFHRFTEVAATGRERAIRALDEWEANKGIQLLLEAEAEAE
ncbi:patatin-like phospholipase family protein [Endozoicomonas lisbonensis]|uniref:NTE family protein n=1 Tax=Endozoicomonas lisbonensis TaxID=3120522 RepID=A0ABV2SMH4_9GAMM